MKFIVSSLKLLKSLQALSGVIGSNNTLPILDDFLFQLSDSGLKITVSDLETTMTVNLMPDGSAKLHVDGFGPFGDCDTTGAWTEADGQITLIWN